MFTWNVIQNQQSNLSSEILLEESKRVLSPRRGQEPAYALDMSVTLAEEIAAVVTFYASYPGLDYSRASAAYLCHFAEDDPFEPAESVAEMEQALQAAGRPVTCYTYPGTKHWFFEENRPEYDAQAARLAWERTIAFLHERLE